MVLSREGYRPRLVDQELEKALRIYGAINIKGPKWCGKTWSAYNCCNSAVRLDDPNGDYQNRRLAQMNPSLVLEGNPPQLIDEWQEVPSIWDAVRYRVDSVPKNPPISKLSGLRFKFAITKDRDRMSMGGRT